MGDENAEGEDKVSVGAVLDGVVNKYKVSDQCGFGVMVIYDIWFVVHCMISFRRMYVCM